MKYLSVCSGIEAASVAWEPLGWKPLAFSEIEPFPRAVLGYHYPDTPLYGDFTELKDKEFIVDADLLCGGTPCQAFSVAGLRQSLSDDRGNLTLQFVKLADAIDDLRSAAGRQPSWVLWENVPGVFSTNDNAFGAFLGGLCGRHEPIPKPDGGWPSAGVVDGPTRCAAWRVLDAQHFGLAQRRKRVFVLARGGAGRWAAADALLPIIQGSSWHPAPSRGEREGVAGKAKGSAGVGVEGVDYENNPVWAGEPMGPLMKDSPTGGGRPLPVVAFAQNTRDEVRYQGDGDICGALAAEPGMKQTTYIAFDPRQIHHPANHSNPQPSDPCHPLAAGMHPPMLVRMREGKEGGGKGPLVSEDQSLTLATANDQILALAPTLTASNDPSRSPQSSEVTQQVAAVYSSTMQVRRLTPKEAARLQGFPDDYLDITYRGKPAADGNKYKALGNSWAVPCVRYIGEQIGKQ